MRFALDLVNRQRQWIVVDDRTGRLTVNDCRICRAGQCDAQRLVELANGIALNLQCDRFYRFADGELHIARQDGARRQIGCIGCAIEVYAEGHVRGQGGPARTAHREGQQRRATIAFGNAGIENADLAGIGCRKERLAGVGRAKGVGNRRCRPSEIGIAAATADQLQREAVWYTLFCYADVRAGQTIGRAANGNQRAFIRQELDDAAQIVDQRNSVGRAVLDAKEGKWQGAKAVALVADHA